mmetsp:Transcript_915/g.1465  ORF Transcript_915/g.1465 Transcript_915/m.1465 type:complete len:225 (+) Transcript_915:100-774(+)
MHTFRGGPVLHGRHWWLCMAARSLHWQLCIATRDSCDTTDGAPLCGQLKRSTLGGALSRADAAPDDALLRGAVCLPSESLWARNCLASLYFFIASTLMVDFRFSSSPGDSPSYSWLECRLPPPVSAPLLPTEGGAGGGCAAAPSSPVSRVQNFLLSLDIPPPPPPPPRSASSSAAAALRGVCWLAASVLPLCCTLVRKPSATLALATTATGRFHVVSFVSTFHQ